MTVAVGSPLLPALKHALLVICVLTLCTSELSLAFCPKPRQSQSSHITGSDLIAFSKQTSRCATPDPDNEGNEDSIASRFLSPRIDDIGLPLADALVAQIVAPSFQVFWLGLTHAPLPTWLRPLSATLFATRGSLLAPTLIHGAGLACCWISGALAARAFEADAFNVSEGRGYGTVISRTISAGAFATGLLILSAQIDLFLEFGGFVQLGETEQTDIRITTAFVEVLNDVFFEAVTLSGWRLYRASLTADSTSQ